MTVLYLIAILAVWLLPILISLSIVFDGERLRVSDRRLAFAVLADAVLLWMVWFRPAGPFGPISQLLALLHHTVSSQQLVSWSVTMMLSAAVGLLVGLLVRNVRYRRGFRLRRTRVSMRGRRFTALAFAVAAIGASLLLSAAADSARQISIQEVCRRARGVDEDRAYVVLKNDGDWPNAPKELFLTTDPDEPAQYRTSSLSIAPGDTAQVSENADLFLSIRRSGGDTVFLMDDFGRVLDSVELPELLADMAYRRTDAGWELAAVAENTDVQISAPTFSAPGGFYDEAFDLTLRAAPGQQIYYTTDGSTPDADSALYTAPIHVYDRSGEANRYRSVQNVQEDYLDKEPIGKTPVDKAFVVRAVAMDEAGKSSEIATLSYFINKNDYASGLVISLTADPDELFGTEGIYVTGEEYDAWYAEKRAAEAAGKTFEEEAPTPNYQRRGAETERAAELEVFDDGAPLLNQPVGIRIQGNTSSENALKRFSVFARSIYSGSRLLRVSPFSGKDTHSFILRSGLVNAINHAMAAGRDVAVLQTRPARAFLNGEFWYDTFVQEKYNRTYFEKTFHVFRENVEYIEIGVWSNATQEERDTVESLLTLAEQEDLRSDESYEQFCRQIDVQSYIDYCCIQAYLLNADTNEHLNTGFWRTGMDEHTTYGDGRWRWVLNDLDPHHGDIRKAVGAETAAEINPFTAKRGEDWDNMFHDGRLYQALMENPTFRTQLARTFMDLVNTNFTQTRMEQILASFGVDMDYDGGFFRDRTGYMIGYVAEEVGISDTTAALTLQTDTPDAGTVRLNTITPDLSSGAWSGEYYTDLSVLLTASPAPGHTFDHWEVNGERLQDAEIELKLSEGGTTVHAVFR